MKSLGIYLKPYIKESILAPIFKFLEVLFDLLVPSGNVIMITQ